MNKKAKRLSHLLAIGAGVAVAIYAAYLLLSLDEIFISKFSAEGNQTSFVIIYALIAAGLIAFGILGIYIDDD